MSESMKVTAPPRSDQWNAEDFTGGPRTFTVTAVKPGKAEQRYDIELVEGEGRVWRPPLTVLRILIAAWTDDATSWPGNRVTLYLDPTVKFGGSAVGGIRVSHLSGIEKALSIPLSVSRGKRLMVTVQPLPDESGRDWLGELELAGHDLTAVEALGHAAKDAHAPKDILTTIRARYSALAAEETAS